MALSAAERQRRFRDRKRGGPPLGRWHGHESLAEQAAAIGCSRTTVFRLKWLFTNAPEAAERAAAGVEKITPLYYRLRREYDEALIRFVETDSAECASRFAEGFRLAPRYTDGQFMFQWVREGGTA